MNDLEADAFVFFGATRDLAYEQIFSALQEMITHGHFDMPIIGMAKSTWSLDHVRGRRASHDGGTDRPRCGGLAI
jgi:glucose-6-phosphate 1-dehydrogenase